VRLGFLASSSAAACIMPEMSGMLKMPGA